MGGDWENLPADLLVHLYSFLGRRERLACSLVCRSWKEGLDHVMLWKTVAVHVDADLMEPSTVLLSRDYCKYIKNLEFGWAVPHRNNRYTPTIYKELTKRAVRFFLILYDNYIQISSIRIFNWFDFLSFHKVTYHLARFLKNQMHLKTIIFDNINMHSPNYMKLLTSCLGSGSTITTLDIKSCYYCQSSFDSIYFRSCLEQLSQLKTFKLDYFVLSCKLIDSILTSRNRSLQNLEITLRENICAKNVIDDEHWCLLCSVCPNLRVTFIIRNVYLFSDLKIYLKQSIPIGSLSISIPHLLDKGGRCNFRKTLNLVTSYYYETLETVDLLLKNDNETLDDILLMMVKKCQKLQSLVYNGYFDNPTLLMSSFEDVNYVNLVPNDDQLDYIFSKMEQNDVQDMKRKRVRFTVLRKNCRVRCSMLILN